MKIGSDAPVLEDFWPEERKAGCDQEGLSAELGCGGGGRPAAPSRMGL